MTTNAEYIRQMSRIRAKRVFTHYMEFLFTKAGVPVQQDNRVEWDEIIDDIITAAGGESAP